MARVKLGQADEDLPENIYPPVPKITSGDFALFSEYLSYEPTSGDLRWKKQSNRRLGYTSIGSIAGSTTGPYCQVWLKGKPYFGHRIAWLLTTGSWPISRLDHRDRNGRNNAWANLRLATASQNMQNKRLHSNNTSGASGVYEEKGKFRACVFDRGRKLNLGTFDTKEAAVRARNSSAKLLYGEFGRRAERVRLVNLGVGQ